MEVTATDHTEEIYERALALAEALDPTAGDVEAERKLAETLVDLRASIRGSDGKPDWFGQTQEYRWRAQVVYTGVNTDKENLQRLKGRLRQHYLRIVPDKMEQAELVEALKRAEDSPVALDGSFLDNLGTYIADYGTRSVDGTEAQVLVLLAGKLLNLIDPRAIDDAHIPTFRLTLEQVVVENARRLQEAVTREG